jgi:hypothetical protein
MSYTPFDKNFTELEEPELNELIEKGISEGWYIEYKVEFPKKAGGKLDQEKIAKTIASFANTKGGWLFYGIKTDDKNIATELCGVNLSEYQNIADQISQIIAGNIAPNPVFHIKIVKLNQTENYIIIIQVEESPIPPYITSQGVIYQRENNECRPVKDRYILEKLYEKTNDYYSIIDNFCSVNYGETKGQSESNQSYLELYLFPLPYGSFVIDNFYSTDFFKKTASKFYSGTELTLTDNDKKSKLTFDLRFNSIYSSQKSLIIRPLFKENLIYKTTTVELFVNAGLKFIVPLSEFNLKNVPSRFKESKVIEYLRNKYSSKATIHPFNTNDLLSGSPIETDFDRIIKMIDGAEIMHVMLAICSIYKAILQDSGFDMKTKIGFRTRLTGIWRKFIFFDNEDYLEKVKLYNIPLAPKNELEIPRFSKGNFYSITLDDYSYIALAGMILQGIGLPDVSSIKFTDIFHDSMRSYSDD